MRKILLLYTGGTIGMIRDETSGLLRPFGVDNILEQIPKLKTIPAIIDAKSVSSPKDSANMRPQDWLEIAEFLYNDYENYDGFVVLHGTDTMAYTTSALSFMFQNLAKPIIFTGSQLPIGELRTDALENVLTAIEIALLQKDKKPVVAEVCLYFGNKLFRGNSVTKVSSENFHAFDSPNDTPLIISNISLEVNYAILRKPSEGNLIYRPFGVKNDIFVCKIHPLLTEQQFLIICKTISFKVLILQSYGSGTLFNEAWLYKALSDLKNEGVVVINTSQCVYGEVKGVYEVSEMLQSSGVISGGNMTLEAVLAKSAYLLSQNLTYVGYKVQFLKNIGN